MEHKHNTSFLAKIIIFCPKFLYTILLRICNSHAYQAFTTYNDAVIKYKNLGQVLYFCPKFLYLITANVYIIRYTFTSSKIINIGHI